MKYGGGRNLSLHPHIHVLISHGGLNDAGLWVEPKKSVLFPQKPMMMVFRGKLLEGIQDFIAQGKLIFPTGENDLTTDQRLSRLTLKDWVVHCCPRYDYAEGVAKYLSRYVKRGPMRNQQLRLLDSGLVRVFTFNARSFFNAIVRACPFVEKSVGSIRRAVQ